MPGIEHYLDDQMTVYANKIKRINSPLSTLVSLPTPTLNSEGGRSVLQFTLYKLFPFISLNSYPSPPPLQTGLTLLFSILD